MGGFPVPRFIPAEAFEVRSGLRKYGGWALFFYAGAFAGLLLPYVSFVSLWFLAIFWVEFFRDCEPEVVLCSRELPFVRFICRKTARNLCLYALVTAPVCLLYTIVRPGELFSLPPDEITAPYSTGMRKKLALLAALKPDKPILILDEPFNGLDLESVHLLCMILDRLRARGKTILVTSHIYESLEACCDYIHYLSRGFVACSYPREKFSLLQGELLGMMERRFGDSIRKLLPDSF